MNYCFQIAAFVIELGVLSVTAVLIIAGIFGFYMAWTIGANDVANAMGTSVGSGALSLKKAIILAGILEFLGAVLAGGSVTKTVKGKIVDPTTTFVHAVPMPDGTTTFQFAPELYVYGMLAALLGTAIWLTIATRWGMPVSTTHSIIGGVLGAGIFAAAQSYGWGQSGDSVNWETLKEIFQSWLFAPIIGGAIAFGLFALIRLTIFQANDPLQAARRWRPIYIFLDVLIITMATMLKGLKNVDWYANLHLTNNQQWIWSFLLALAITAIIEILLRRRQVVVKPTDDQYKAVERTFIGLQIVTAGSVAFAHGANDVANAIGPLAGIVATLETGTFQANAPLHWWILPLGGIGIVIGLATWGHKVMKTIGQKISEITPSRGFSAELATAATIIFATIREIPVSTSQILVGSVLGVGLARGVAAIDLRVLRDIVASWLLTLPAAGLISGLLFIIFKGLLLPGGN